MTALIIHIREIVSKCYYAGCFVYFMVSRLRARLLLCMTGEMTISGRDNTNTQTAGGGFDG